MNLDTITIAGSFAALIGVVGAWIGYMSKKTPDETEISKRVFRRVEELEKRNDKQADQIQRQHNELAAAVRSIEDMRDRIRDLESEVNTLLLSSGKPTKYAP